LGGLLKGKECRSWLFFKRAAACLLEKIVIR